MGNNKVNSYSIFRISYGYPSERRIAETAVV